jgi:hypothetical protein
LAARLIHRGEEKERDFGGKKIKKEEREKESLGCYGSRVFFPFRPLNCVLPDFFSPWLIRFINSIGGKYVSFFAISYFL